MKELEKILIEFHSEMNKKPKEKQIHLLAMTVNDIKWLSQNTQADNGETLVSSSDYAKLQAENDQLRQSTIKTETNPSLQDVIKMQEENERLRKAFEELLNDYAGDYETSSKSIDEIKSIWYEKAGISQEPTKSE